MIKNLTFGVVYLLISNFLVGSQIPKKLATKIFHIAIVSVGLVGQVTTSYARDSQFIQTLLWSLEFVIQLNLKHDTSTIQFLSKKFILQGSSHSILQKIYPSNKAKSLTHFTNWCQIKHLHCTISMHPKAAFSKHLEIKCLYISANLQKKIFVTETQEVLIWWMGAE